MSVVYLKGSGETRYLGDVPATLALPISSPVPELLDQQLQKILVVPRTRLGGDAQSLADHRGYALAVLEADCSRNVQTPGQKSFNQLRLLKAEPGRLRKDELRFFRGVEKQAGLAIGTLMDHQRPTHKIPHPATSSVSHHGYPSYSVMPGQPIH